MSDPAPVSIRQLDTHRLIPSKCSCGESVLNRVADGDGHLRTILELDHLTNDRLLAGDNRMPGIGVDELVFGVPHYRAANATFSHAHPLGGRFNGPNRGNWYAGFTPETSQAEVAWHKSVELAEVNWFKESITYDDHLADFGGEFQDIRDDPSRRNRHNPESCADSQQLAETLLAEGSLGIIDPSARHNCGVCLACFRPAPVGNVRRGAHYRFTWADTPEPEVEFEEACK